MSVSLSVVNGSLVVDIADHKGGIQRYRVEVLASTVQRFSVRLVKIDDPGELAYLVQIGERFHTCDCPHFKYRRDIRPDGCKHILHLKEVRKLLALLPAVATQETKN